MRLPLLSTQSLTAEQKPLYEDMRDGITTELQGLHGHQQRGRADRPVEPLADVPKCGGPVWELVKALSISPELPRPVREVAILVTGAKFHSAYEIYAHVLAAELRGLPDEKIATIVAGQRPSDLTEEEGIAYDVASNLVSGGVLPALTYKRAVGAFGEEGAAEFIYLVGLYCAVSVTLNGFDVPLPEDGACAGGARLRRASARRSAAASLDQDTLAHPLRRRRRLPGEGRGRARGRAARARHPFRVERLHAPARGAADQARGGAGRSRRGRRLDRRAHRQGRHRRHRRHPACRAAASRPARRVDRPDRQAVHARPTSAWRWPCASSRAHLRETGESKGYNASFTRADRSRFLQALERPCRPSSGATDWAGAPPKRVRAAARSHRDRSIPW